MAIKFEKLNSKQEFPLTYGEMVKRDGVYSGNELTGEQKLVVMSGNVYFYSGSGIHPTTKSALASTLFKKLNERFVVE